MKILNPTNFFVARISSLPSANFGSLNDAMRAKDISLIKSYFKEIKFLNALYFASKEFYEVALNWLQNDDIEFSPSDRVLQSLYKYYIRMCCRCTPYGLFAGFASGQVSQGPTDIVLENEKIIPKARTDVYFLKHVKDEIFAKQGLLDIPLYPNNTMYVFGSNWRYINWINGYNYEILEIPQDPILDSIIKLAKPGIKKIEIEVFLQNKLQNVSKEEIDDYVNALIENKILVDRVPPFMTSLDDPLCELEDYLRKYKFQTNSLKSILAVRKNITSKNLLNSNKVIKEIDRLSNQFEDSFNKKHQIFQIDSKITLKNNVISENITSRLAKRAEEIIPLVKSSIDYRMSNFIKRFYKKFETQEIPLVKALDPDFGVGYDLHISGNLEHTPLLNNIYFTFKNFRDSDAEVSPLIKLILKKYNQSFSPINFTPIKLSEKDVKEASIDQEKLPSFGFNSHLFGSFICKNSKDLNTGNFKFLPSSPIPTANAHIILSRFAYYDEELRKNLEDITEKDSGQCVYAELLHHREDRLGNVLLRPNFYNYDLPYASESKREGSCVISIDDLYIRYEQGEIKLRSKRLNKDVKPRYSNAYNYNENQLPVINFLGDFQFYGVDSGFKWGWGILKNNNFLPRVEYKELILSEARWRIEKNENITIDKLKKIINTSNIPKLCKIKKRDNVIVLATNEDTCLHILMKEIAKRAITVYEYLDPLRLPNENGEEFSAEFIFPLLNKVEVKEQNESYIDSEKKIKRKFLPGEDWSFFKIYTSHKYGDTIIRKVIKPYMKQFSTIEKTLWHYIRYNDPEFHIRFRVKHKLNQERIEYINNLIEDLVEEGIVSSIEIDTYKREVERYGSYNMELSEEFFFNDSVAILELISSDDLLDEELRWKIGLMSLHFLMDDFDIPLRMRIQIFDELFQTFTPENVDVSNSEYLKEFKKSIEKKYKENLSYIDSILRLNNYSEVESFVKPLNFRSQKNAAIAGLIKNNCSNQEIFKKLIKDYVHINMNRIFVTKARMHELVIYFFMFRTYNSIYHRMKKSK
ncbi:lantibiotic dehydratase [Zunongwangia sp. F363]|uniref:Lantibiotic dehydratase n=1 Tax=Autumnicola tepida TaxID=3075595 RepID=A0ABU3C5H4_9FLAO|nr:lantibiotic dehydratase [Zunongwangia sp. F363]MDT0641582.1 lantibiotic dehydratase [Zunongwangia sp. F363]